MSKIGPKSNPSGKQVHTVQVQQGTLVKSTLDFDTITTNIIKKVSRHLPKPNHPEYTRVLEEFKPLLTGHLTANKILSTFHNRLKSDNIALLQALAQNNIENRKGMIEILCQRINSSHFFLNTVIPLFDVDKLYEFKVNLVNILWEDIVALMNNIAFLYEKNISTPAEKIAHFEIAQHYFSLLDIYANDFTTILDDVLFERPTKLSAVIVSEIKRNLFYGYNNFVNIYGDYAFICGFVSQFDDAKKAYVKAKKLFLFLKEHQNPLAACSGEAPDIFKDRVARMEQKLNYLKAAYDDEHPSPLNGLVGTLNTFQEEFQKDLLKLQSSTYVPSPPLTDEEFKRYLKELEQDVQNTKLLLDAIKTEKLEEFSISFRMHLMHTMTYCSQLGNATPLQAKNLLVPIKEIFVLWRKAADSWPGNMTHRRILGIFDSLCRACITASVAIATAGTAKPAALPAPAPAPAPAPSMPLEPAALPSSSLVPKEETLEEKMTKCSQLAKEMQKDVTRLIEKSRTGKIRTSPIPPEVQCERMQAVKQLLLNISEAAEPSTKLGQLIPLITRTKNLIIDINQFIGHNMLSQVLQTASSVLSSLSSLFAVTSTTPDADIVDTLKRTGEAIEEEQRRLEEPPKPEIEVAPTPAPTSPKPIEDKSPEKTSPVLSAPTRRGRTKTSHRHEASTDAPPKEDDNIPVVKEILQFVSLPDVSSEKKLDRMAKKAKKREVKDGAMQALALSKQQKEQEAREKEQARALKER
ncbi:MAG: hypothetical protein JSR17_12845, partial [Proteobacteria bacterium]|nr:hypothetical protein [Pseudomonadota bacterium]